jgi:hypothetical protein
VTRTLPTPLPVTTTLDDLVVVWTVVTFVGLVVILAFFVWGYRR